MQALHVLIAGGGIGGLTAALCLARDGHKITLLEQGDAFTEAGAGIQLSPNCTRVLKALGLDEVLAGAGFLPQATQFRDWRSGAVIAETPLGDAVLTRYGAPYYHIHRGDLLALLVEAARATATIDLHLDCRVTAVAQDDGVAVETSGGAFAADALIGADGIHSIVREQLWGAERATFTGNVAWRALVPVEALPADRIRPVTGAWWGPQKHFVHYYVRGGDLVNCVCVVEKDGWDVESWTEPGEKAELTADFAGWHDDVRLLIEAADPTSLFKWALYDRPPMAAWGQGAVTLLGDACHPTLPFMAQGAAMAIEDGAVLAACLRAGGDVATALTRYENLRRERTAGIQKGSRRNATVFHLSGVKAWLRNRAVRRAGQSTMDRLYRYDALSAVKGA